MARTFALLLILLRVSVIASSVEACDGSTTVCNQSDNSDMTGLLQARTQVVDPQNPPSPFILGPVFERTLKNEPVDEKGPGIVLQEASLDDAKRIESHDTSLACPCTWDDQYPCSLQGQCWSLGTKSSCEGHGGNFCAAESKKANACTCTWNKAYPCQLWGSCYSVTTKSGCEGYGGTFCGDDSGPPPTPPPTPPPAPPPSPSSSQGDSAGDLQSVLDQHNTLRAKHQAPALTWDASLAQDAKSWADKCNWQHSTMGHGENLWAGYGSTFDGASATTSWYNELKNPGYDFNSPGFSSGTGHFTQVVWKSTTKLGCAMTVCNKLSGPNWSNAQFLVCEYSPPGNYQGVWQGIPWQGQFGANVKPAQ